MFDDWGIEDFSNNFDGDLSTSFTNVGLEDLSWVDGWGLGDDPLANFDGDPTTVLGDYGLEVDAGSSASWVRTLTNALTGRATGNQTVDDVAALLQTIGGTGLDILKNYQAYQSNQGAIDALKSQTALNKEKEANSWTQNLLGNYGGMTDKMSELTSLALKSDLMKDYITNRNVKQDWLGQKMAQDGGLNYQGGLSQIRDSAKTLFGALDTAKNDQLGFRSDYGALRSVLPSIQYGSTTNPFSFMNNQSGGNQMTTPSLNKLTGDTTLPISF